MNKNKKYPIDFVAMVNPFEDEDIKDLLSQPAKAVTETIDLLKLREVNATKALAIIRLRIETQILKLEGEMLKCKKYNLVGEHQDKWKLVQILNKLL